MTHPLLPLMLSGASPEQIDDFETSGAVDRPRRQKGAQPFVYPSTRKTGPKRGYSRGEPEDVTEARCLAIGLIGGQLESKERDREHARHMLAVWKGLPPEARICEAWEAWRKGTPIEHVARDLGPQWRGRLESVRALLSLWAKAQPEGEDEGDGEAEET